MKNYSELLKSPKWQKKRLEILQEDNWTCWECGDTKTTLHVHHTEYREGKKPWEYPRKCLKTLCEVCHKRKHSTNWQEVNRKYNEKLFKKYLDEYFTEKEIDYKNPKCCIYESGCGENLWILNELQDYMNDRSNKFKYIGCPTGIAIDECVIDIIELRFKNG